MYRKTIAATLALGLVATLGTASAASGVSISAVDRDGTSLTLRGTASFADQPFLTLGTDPTTDAGIGWTEIGGDLRGLAAATTLDGDVKLRFLITSQPAQGAPPGLVHGWWFCVSGGSCYEMDVQRYTTAADGNLPTAGRVSIYRCATPACEEAGQTHVASGFNSTFYGGGLITTTLPSATLGVTGGTTIAGGGDGAVAFSALGSVDPRAIVRSAGDRMSAMNAYVVPTRQVSVALDAPGLSPATVAYGAPVTPNGAGAWTATIDASGASGERELYARACFGENNCVYTSQPISL